VTSELDDLLFFLHLSCIPVSQLSTLNGTLGDDSLGATHFTAMSRFRGHVLSVTHLFTFPEYPLQLSNKTPPYYRIPFAALNSNLLALPKPQSINLQHDALTCFTASSILHGYVHSHPSFYLSRVPS